jgi:hypothetical protein
LEQHTEENKALRDGLSDIGRFSLSESFFEEIRRSRARGLFEHGIILGMGLETTQIFGRERDKCAEFRRAEKIDEGMALKI